MMHDQPLTISVLVACWNGERYVAEALESILRQEPPPGEVIAVDDGSTDASAAVMASFAPRVTLLRQSNQGVAAALDAAAARASGEAIAFLDADDLWLPGKLARQSAALAADPALDGVFGHMSCFASPDLPEAERATLRIDASAVPGLVKGALLLRRAAFDRIGGFGRGPRAADFIAWYARAAALGFHWRMLPETVCLRRIHQANMSRSNRPQQHADYLQVMRDSLVRRRAVQDRGA